MTYVVQKYSGNCRNDDCKSTNANNAVFLEFMLDEHICCCCDPRILHKYTQQKSKREGVRKGDKEVNMHCIHIIWLYTHDACDLQMRTYYINSSGLKMFGSFAKVHQSAYRRMSNIRYMLHVALRCVATLATKLKLPLNAHINDVHVLHSVSFGYFIHIALRFSLFFISIFVPHLPFRLINTATICLSVSLSVSLSLTHTNTNSHVSNILFTILHRRNCTELS